MSVVMSLSSPPPIISALRTKQFPRVTFWHIRMKDVGLLVNFIVYILEC